MRALAANGANLGRLKVWVNPADGCNTAKYVVRTALQMQAAGMRVLKRIFPSAKVVLHLTNLNDNIGQQHVPFDVIGLSYYPYWHGSLADLQQAVTTRSARYDKDVLNVETSSPWTLTDQPVLPHPNVIDQQSQLAPGYPATPAGQAASFKAIQDVVASALGGRGLGSVDWEPAWTTVAGSGWDPTDPSAGNAWENQAVFDHSGRALPAIRDFGPNL